LEPLRALLRAECSAQRAATRPNTSAKSQFFERGRDGFHVRARRFGCGVQRRPHCFQYRFECRHAVSNVDAPETAFPACKPAEQPLAAHPIREALSGKPPMLSPRSHRRQNRTHHALRFVDESNGPFPIQEAARFAFVLIQERAILSRLKDVKFNRPEEPQ
jgi:hypothetical protein